MVEALDKRTDEILRTLWHLSQGGRFTVRKYRVGDITGFALTPREDRALLATGLVREINGMGGPSSYRFTITALDL